MVRKGKIQEIFSRAKFADQSSLYMITYRDFDRLVEVTLDEFLKRSENFTLIPASRIRMIKKKNRVLFTKSKK